MLYLNCFLLALSVVIIIDLSDLVGTIKRKIQKELKTNGEIKLKPLDCSFCMSFWLNLCYVLIMSNLTPLLLFYILFLSFMTPVFLSTLVLIKDVLQTILYKINSIL